MLAQCTPGTKYQGNVLITEWKEVLFRNKPGTYIALSCQDRSGQLEGKIWETNERILNLLNEYDVFYIVATVNEFRGNLDLAIESLNPLEEQQIDFDELLPCSPCSADELEQRLTRMLNTIKTPALKELLEVILCGPIGQAYRTAPAALKIHQAYRRGLWEHSVAVAEVALKVAEQYPEIDRDLVVTGALLHDIGKVFEYDYERAIKPTTDGRLLGHIVMGVDYLSQVTSRLTDFPAGLRSKLLHILTSHHGRYEWQSPKRPKCMEAVVVHHADALEAELWQFRQAKIENPEESWSPYVRSLEKYLYLE